MLKTRDTDPRFFLERLALGVNEHGIPLPLGGDGFVNQAHLALWAIKQKNEDLDADKEQVRIFCIEEVEAHLHPHQQRRLAKFMLEHFKGNQILLTTHSSQIASNFDTKSIIKIVKSDGHSTIENEQSCALIYKNKVDFGYRMNAISAEIYYSDIIILVEGPSELLFYKAADQANNIDLDRYNISIISIDGVGFKPYLDLAITFGVKCVCRTDNDILKVPKKSIYRFAGTERGCSLVKSFYDDNIKENMNDDYELLRWNGDENANYNIIEKLENYDIFIADIDLETDLLETPLQQEIINFFNCDTKEKAVAKLQEKKATHMFNLFVVV